MKRRVTQCLGSRIVERESVSDRDRQPRDLETVSAADMPHVPERGADLLSHQYALAGVAEGAHRDRVLHLHVVQPEPLVVLEPARAERDRSPGAHVQANAAGFGDRVTAHYPTDAQRALAKRGNRRSPPTRSPCL